MHEKILSVIKETPGLNRSQLQAEISKFNLSVIEDFNVVLDQLINSGRVKVIRYKCDELFYPIGTANLSTPPNEINNLDNSSTGVSILPYALIFILGILLYLFITYFSALYYLICLLGIGLAIFVWAFK